jgi:hypothetical protein
MGKKSKKIATEKQILKRQLAKAHIPCTKYRLDPPPRSNLDMPIEVFHLTEEEKFRRYPQDVIKNPETFLSIAENHPRFFFKIFNEKEYLQKKYPTLYNNLRKKVQEIELENEIETLLQDCL